MKVNVRNAIIIVVCFIGGIFKGNSQTNADCIYPIPICEKKSYHYSNFSGPGDIHDKVDDFQCTSNDFREVNSKWLKFRIAESGTLLFTIDPEDPYHDIDFILFQTDDFNCESKEEVRCMASGESFTQDPNVTSNCLGSTGIQMKSTDEFEASGCKYNDDNYLKYLQAKKGETYLLFINDYHKDGALSISFDGTAELQPLIECREDKNIDLQIVNIFPNPANEKINLEVNFKNDFNSDMQITIMNQDSRRIRSISIGAQESTERITMNISDLTSGSYLIRIIQGDEIAVKQFIKI